MNNYLDYNKAYWEKGYNAVNVDHPVFRFYGRILRPEFGLGANWERLVDFGCGQGAAVNFFHAVGFQARGVDISETDIAVAKIRYPHIAQNFSICAPDPKKNEYYGFAEDIAVITAIQSLYYFSDSDFQACMDVLYRSMRPGGVFFATMMGENSREFLDNSTEFRDGLRVVNFRNDRLEVKNYYMSFIKDEDHLKRKFDMFKPVHIGYYAAKFRSDEGDGFHFTFCGVK
jgi:SAM-dependent methyltransferase